MQKQTIISQVETLGLTDDVKQELMGKLASYPDEMTNEQVMDFEGFVMDAQRGEQLLARAYDTAAEGLEDAADTANDSIDEFVTSSAQIMRDNLEDAEELLGGTQPTATQPPQTPPPAAPVG